MLAIATSRALEDTLAKWLRIKVRDIEYQGGSVIARCKWKLSGQPWQRCTVDTRYEPEDVQEAIEMIIYEVIDQAIRADEISEMKAALKGFTWREEWEDDDDRLLSYNLGPAN